MKKMVCLILLSFVLTVFSVPAFADAGNVNRYDSYDSYGSGDYGYDSGGYSGGYGGRIYVSPSSDYHEDESVFSTVITVIMIIAVCVFITYIKSKKGKDTKTYTRPRGVRAGDGAYHGGTGAAAQNGIPDRSAEVEAEIRKRDPEFSSQKLTDRLRDNYIKLQSAWTARDIESVRVLVSSELFETYKTQLEEYISEKRINVVERVAVNQAYITGFRRDGEREYVTAYLYAVMRDYITDETTGNVLEGRKDIDAHMRYIITLSRSLDALTEAGNVRDCNCPNCGAPVNIASSGRCEYCNSVIVTDDHGWVISELRGA